MHINTSASHGMHARTLLQPNVQAPLPQRAAATAQAEHVAEVAPSRSSFDTDAVAKPVLDFVSQRLADEAAAGASSEDLASLIQQAREGARQGVGQAVDMLKQNGAYSDELGSGAADALLKMQQGFDQLAQQYGLAQEGAVESTAVDTTDAMPVPATVPLASRVQDYRAAFASQQRVALEVKTADGDTIRLRIGTSEQQRGALQVGDSGMAALYESSSSAGLSLEVDGQLDDGEMKALNDLLSGVAGVADSFFGGDMAGAFEQAQGLNFDSSELSSMSLRMSKQVSAYQRVQSMPVASDVPATVPSASGMSEPQAGLASALGAMMPAASRVAEHPASLLRELLAAQAALADELPKGLLDFADRLLGAMAGVAPLQVAAPATALPEAVAAPEVQAPAAVAEVPLLSA